MKKTVKIFASIFVLVIALSSILIFATSADGESATAPVVVSANINYRGSFGIMLAIDSSTVKDGKVTVEFTYDGKTSTVTDTTPETIAKLDPELEKTYYVLESPGIPAADMDKEVIYTVTDGANNQSTGTISVAEYFFKRLFVNGIIEATEGPDYDRRDFYIYTLGFGAKAQNILYNYDNDDNNNIADGEYVTDLKSYTLNGKMVGIYDNSTTVSDPLPAYTGEVPAGMSFGGYTVTKYDADNDYAKTVTTAAVGDTITIDQHTVVTPNFELKLGAGEYYNNEEIGGNRWDYTNLNNVAIDGAGNSVTYELIGGQLVGTRDTTDVDSPNEGYVKYVHNGFTGSENTPMFVYETDFMFEGYEANVTAGTKIGRFDFRFGNADFLKMFEFYITAVSVNNGTVTVAKFGEIELVAGNWYNIRFVYDKAANTFDYYRNGEKVATGAAKEEKGNSANRNWSCWYLEKTTTKGVMKFDNTIAACFDANPPVGGEYFQNTSIDGVRMDGDNLLSSLNSPNSTKGNDTVALVDGKLVYTKVGSGESYIRWDHSGKGEATAPVLVFEADITIDDIAMGSATNGTFANIYLAIDGTEYTVPLQFWSTYAYYGGSSNGATTNMGQKYNIRIVVDVATKTVDYYVDGGLIKENVSVTISSRSNNWVRFLFRSDTTAGRFEIDNVFIGVIDNGAVSE